jgi:hypothetical protein
LNGCIWKAGTSLFALLLSLLLAADPAAAWDPRSLFAPCDGDCGTSVYAGWYVENSMGEVLVTAPEAPVTWEYQGNDRIVATAISRRTGRLWKFDVEPEIGIAQRYGRQSATEVWGAFFFRYHFPWQHPLLMSVAVSTGLNWASQVTDVEQERAKDDEGSQVMHFFAPEFTFALPSRPNVELLLRFHHRSGVFGLVSDAFGGAQYGTVGVRVRF